MNSLPEIAPVDEFIPTPEDEAWACRAFNPGTALAADNGAPRTLREVIDDEGRAYRAWRTPAGDLLADTLDRLSQLLAWTGAANPRDHADRMDSWDAEIQARHYDRGYADGYEAARREFGPRPYN